MLKKLLAGGVEPKSSKKFSFSEPQSRQAKISVEFFSFRIIVSLSFSCLQCLYLLVFHKHGPYRVTIVFISNLHDNSTLASINNKFYCFLSLQDFFRGLLTIFNSGCIPLLFPKLESLILMSTICAWCDMRMVGYTVFFVQSDAILQRLRAINRQRLHNVAL